MPIEKPGATRAMEFRHLRCFLALADEALYRAKRGGRDRVVWG